MMEKYSTVDELETVLTYEDPDHGIEHLVVKKTHNEDVYHVYVIFSTMRAHAQRVVASSPQEAKDIVLRKVKGGGV